MVNKKNNNISVREFYTLIDQKITQVNESIQRLETKFDQLESGKLSNLATKVANIEGRILATAGIMAFVISATIAIAGFLLK